MPDSSTRTDFFSRDTILDHFLPADPDRDAMASDRMRLFIGSHWLAAGFGLFLLYGLLTLLGGWTTSLAIVSGLFMVFLLNPVLLRAGVSYGVLARLAIIEILALVLYANYAIGGGWSFALYWVLPVPMLALLWLGARACMASTLVVVVALLVFHSLQQTGFTFPMSLAATDQPWMNVIALVTAVMYSSQVGRAYWRQARLRHVALRSELQAHRASEVHLARQIADQALFDPLTGLINRRQLEQRVGRLLDAQRDDGDSSVLLYIDLDGFNRINEQCGHSAGDQFLTQIGLLLVETTRKRDSLARVGADEFALLLDSCPLERAMQLAEELCETIQRFHFIWKDKSCSVTASIGIAPLTARYTNIASLFDAAESACRQAGGTGSVQVVSQARQQGTVERWVEKLHQALDGDGFHFYCQTITPVAQGSGWGDHYELLLRLEDDNGDMLAAETFLPVAQRHHLITDIDHWVVTHALQWLAANPDVLGQLYSCGINVSAATLIEDDFVAFTARQFRQSGVPAEKIRFEITDVAAAGNLPQLGKALERLRALGCRIALDDFSTGLPSLAFLRALTVDAVKIDGGYVRDMAVDPVGQAMTIAITGVGHALGLPVIAKCVETREQLRYLSEAGVDYAQGLGIARPVPLESLIPAANSGFSEAV